MKNLSSRRSAAAVAVLILAGGLGLFLSVPPVSAADSASPAAGRSSAAIPWSEIGAKAGAGYRGNGLAVAATSGGARLRCVFQRLEGEATREGLWLTSTVSSTVNDRFRIVATAVGRAPHVAQPSRLRVGGASPPRFVPGDETSPKLAGEDACVTSEGALPRTGTVSIDGQTVRFHRPGLVEEYSVSMDGVRQDFVVTERPSLSPAGGEGRGEGALRLELAVSGAQVEPAALGAQLVLEKSGRKIAYSRLRVTDALGKELPARIEVTEADHQRDLVSRASVWR